MKKSSLTVTRICSLAMIIFALINLLGCEKNNDGISKTTGIEFGDSKESQVFPDDISEESKLSSSNYFYANRTSAARMYADNNVMYYRNVFDDSKLYKYELETGKKTCLTDEVYMVQFISMAGDKLYFSGKDSLDSYESANVYSIDADGNNLTLEIAEADAPIVENGYIYYHDDVVPFISGIYRKNIDTGETEMLVSRDYECSAMTINIVEDTIYFDNSYDIFRYSIADKKVTNITSGKYDSGLNKLQYKDGYLYYYRNDYKDGNSAAVKRMNTETYEEEEVFLFNNGHFWYDNLLVNDDYIIFTGSQPSPLKEGEPKENFVRGTFRYSFEDNEIVKIYPSSLGPTCHLTDDYIISIMNAEDKGINDIVIVDYDGNDARNDFPGLTM